MRYWVVKLSQQCSAFFWEKIKRKKLATLYSATYQNDHNALAGFLF